MKHFKNKIKIDCYFLEDFYFPMFVLVPLLNTGLLIAKCPFLKIIIFFISVSFDRDDVQVTAGEWNGYSDLYCHF